MPDAAAREAVHHADAHVLRRVGAGLHLLDGPFAHLLVIALDGVRHEPVVALVQVIEHESPARVLLMAQRWRAMKSCIYWFGCVFVLRAGPSARTWPGSWCSITWTSATTGSCGSHQGQSQEDARLGRRAGEGLRPRGEEHGHRRGERLHGQQHLAPGLPASPACRRR